MFVIQRLLALRKEHPGLFSRGSYTAVSANGAFADKVVSFERRLGERTLVVVVPRHASSLGFPPLGEVWADTHIPLNITRTANDVFTGHEHPSGKLNLSTALAHLPFSVLLSSD